MSRIMLFGLLLQMSYLLVLVRAQSTGDGWNALYNGRLGYTSYTSDDNLYGLSDDYTRETHSPTCSGCSHMSCPSSLLTPVELTCTGSSISLYSTSFEELNRTSFTDPTTVTSVHIRNNGELDQIYDVNKTGAFDDMVNLNKLRIHYTSVKDFPVVSNTTLQILDLAANNLDFFTANWSRQVFPQALTFVSLRENAIHWVPDRTFSDSNIRILSFSNNVIFAFPTSAVENMTSLLYLGLDGNLLETVSVNHLRSLNDSPIQHLNLHSNAIYYIEQYAFTELKNLTILELQSNQLGTISMPARTIHDMPALLHLDLSNNIIQELKDETITDMPNLLRLKLNNNGLQNISYDAFRNINDSLEILYVNDNALTSFPHQVLSQAVYPNLGTIYANGNQISNVTEFGREAFALHMTSLYCVLDITYSRFSTTKNVTELHLQSNIIAQLTTNDFCEMSVLKTLYLDSNLLTEDTLEEDTFQCLTVLQTLGLSSNQFQYVPEAVKHKAYLPSIKSLTMASNYITFIAPSSFTELDTLATLNLAFNCILSIEDGSFPYQSLSTLILQSNRFRFLHQHPFTNLTALSSLNLGDNDITVIPDDAFHNTTPLDYLNLGSNDIKRILRTHFRDNSLSQGIYLADNDIGFIEDGTFDHISSTWEVNLQNNFLSKLPLVGSFQDLTIAGSGSNDFIATGNYITSLPTGSFSDFSVEDLILSDNKISHIYPGAFNHVSTSSLYLSGNPLKYLYAYSFNHTTHRSVHMSPFGAKVIPSLAFNDVSVSSSINLANSAVETVQTAAFNTVSAQHIYLSNSEITTIEVEAFTDVHISRDLSLSSNHLTELSGNIFGPSSYVGQWLRLDNNQLTTLPDDAFSGATLNYIDLSDNLLVEYPVIALAISSLRIINLDNNKITDLPLGTFTSTNSALQVVYISNNNIKVLQEDLFSDLGNLQKLYLQNNEINSVQPGAFNGLNSLKYLYLGNNLIQFFPSLSLGQLEFLDLSSNTIESIEYGAFNSIVELKTLALGGNPLACDCYLHITLELISSAIISGTCDAPQPAVDNRVHFVASQEATPMYFLNISADTSFLCSANNLAADASKEYEVAVTFDAPSFLFPEIGNQTINNTTSTDNTTSSDNTASPETLPREYSVECTSDSSTTLSEDITDDTASLTNLGVTFDISDGVEPGVTYTCRVSLTLNGSYTSAKSYPVFVTSLTSLNNTFNTGPNDYVLDALYYDFSISHPDFYKVTSIQEEHVSYMRSPYGNWLTEADNPLPSSMAEWFRSVTGTNMQVQGNIVLNYNTITGKHRYWNTNYFPLDTLGYQHENQRDCYSVYHNFGFTSIIKGGMIYQGQGTITVAGGEQLWLAINKTLLLDIHILPTDEEVPCKMVDLTPASQTGGGWVVPQAGTIDPVSGQCNASTSLDEDKVWLQLEVGNSYHFEVFHAERKPCSSQLFIETSDLEFYQDHGNVTGEPATDYFLYVSEDLHLNGIMGEADLMDDFSAGTSFEVNILKGNEARHFTLKENSSANLALGVPPSADSWTYTDFPGLHIPFVECPVPIAQIPELEISGTENFLINSQSALVTLDALIDREVKDRYVLSLEVIDSSTTPDRTGSIVVLIQVQDVNDNCPVISPSNLSLQPIPALEEAPLFYVNMTDEDISQNMEVYFAAYYDTTSPPLSLKYNMSMDYFTTVYNETSDLVIHLVFLDRGTDPVRGSIIKPKVTLSNSCLLTALFNQIEIQVDFNATTGGVHLRIPSYWVDIYECSELVGLSSGWVRDSQLSASSSLDITSLPARARLNTTYDSTGELFGAWVAATNDVSQYWAIDFWEPYRVRKVMIQGRQDAEMWVESYKLLYEDNGGYIEYTDTSGTNVFLGATDQNTIVTTSLDPLIVTQILRVNPQTWHGGIALRLEIVACSVADYEFYNTRCTRCDAGSYCVGDGSIQKCASCDSEPCNATEHSYGGYEACVPCPKGWLCNDGLASPCPLYHYAVCENDTCEDTCRPCPAGFACSGGVITECRKGFFSEELSANCSLCPVGTYQNQTGQGECLNCPAGYESATAIDHCNPCPDGTYSTGDGQPCSHCVDQSLCACESGVAPCFVKDENLKVACRNTAYDGTSFECDPCPPGFVGDGISCVDIDECTDYSPCFSGRCINIEPGYQCLACPYGYTGHFKDGQSASIHNRVFLCDGHTNTSDSVVEQICDDIDECSNNNGGCDINAYCYNSEGSHECGPCKKGYLGSSFYGCHIDNYCLSNNNSCSEQATCIYAGPGAYRCECNDGYTGTGLECGKDTDLDGHPDQSLSTCLGLGCRRDNCPDVPNSGQEDNDNENLGDNCDFDDDNDVVTDILDNCQYVYNPYPNKADTDGDGVGDVCDNCVGINNTDQTDTDGDSIGDECDPDIDEDGVLNATDNCPLIANSDQTDSDGDGLGDVCDNCPDDVNTDQADADENGFGDVCVFVGASFIDRDGDGITDSSDNCPFLSNPQQSDIDNDGTGDDCDEDTDGDGVFNNQDNCVLVPNPGQEDTDENKVGNVCDGDSDGDSISDTEDHCPYNPVLSDTSFLPYSLVYLDPPIVDTVTPKFRVNHEGKEVLMTQSTDVPLIILGDTYYSDVEYSGTWYIDGDSGNNYIGFVFGYQSNRKYYVVMLRHKNSNRDQCIGSIKGLQIKVVDSTTGPDRTMGDALWLSDDTANQVQLLWQDPTMYTWEHRQPIRWHLNWKPSIGLINVRVADSEGVEVINSGDLYDSTIQGGRLGLFAFNQSDVYWSHLTARCSPPHNWALYLDGVDDYVELGEIADYNIEESFTIEVWIKRNDSSIPGKQPIVCTLHSSICLYLQDDKVVGKVGQSVANGTNALPEDYWHHITLRYEYQTETMELYINGTTSGVEGTAADVIGINITNINDTTVYLGRDMDSYFEGTIDEVRIYNRWIPDTYLDNYIASFSPEWSFHQKHLTGHYTMNDYNPWDQSVVQDTGIYGVNGQAFGDPTYKQDTLNFAVFQLAHPNN